MNYSISADTLKGKVILVTGAGNGIGRQAALSYAQHGATVILLGRNVQNLESIYDEIESAGYPQPAIIPLDLKGATKQHYIDMAETIEGQFGRLDGLLHNAGVLSTLCPFEQINEEDFDDIMQINVKAEVLMTQALLPIMRKSEAGRIVFTSSTVGHSGRAFWGPYAISKFAVEGMMQRMIVEWCSRPGVDKSCRKFNRPISRAIPRSSWCYLEQLLYWWEYCYWHGTWCAVRDLVLWAVSG